MAEHPDDPDAYRILGGGVGNVSFIVIDDPKPDSKICHVCKESKLCFEPVTVDGNPLCKDCYDRFYNPEINYRCKGCGSIIPDKGKICNKCGPECVHCKTHEGPFKTIDHKLYCHGCADMCKVRPADNKCPICGKPNNAQGVCDCYCARKDDKTSNG